MNRIEDPSLSKKERLAMILFGVGAIIIIAIFLFTTIPNIRNISVPMKDFFVETEEGGNLRSSIDALSDEWNDNVQNLNKQSQLERVVSDIEEQDESNERSDSQEGEEELFSH